MHPAAHDGEVSEGIAEALERIGRERMMVVMRIMRKDFQEVINQSMSVFVVLRCGWGRCGNGRDLTAVS